MIEAFVLDSFMGLIFEKEMLNVWHSLWEHLVDDIIFHLAYMLFDHSCIEQLILVNFLLNAFFILWFARSLHSSWTFIDHLTKGEITSDI